LKSFQRLARDGVDDPRLEVAARRGAGGGFQQLANHGAGHRIGLEGADRHPAQDGFRDGGELGHQGLAKGRALCPATAVTAWLASGRNVKASHESGEKLGTIREGRLLRNILVALFIVLVAGPVLAVVVYRFVPPPATPLMVIRLVEGKGWNHHWRSIADVSPALPRALIAAEDARFCDHHGFDFDALQKAYENNEKGKKIRGGSTISQQTAKNVFLWPGRSYVRKGLEAYFTVLIETIWGKKRIMEVYLNSIEYGPGIYGAEAASRAYFKVGADQLTPPRRRGWRRSCPAR
jgi:monofunctional biosynthetic peptidoglycan transglycosylase